MRWGVRNGPPYPLSGANKARAQKKWAAAKKSSASDGAPSSPKKTNAADVEVKKTNKVNMNTKTGVIPPQVIQLGAYVVATLASLGIRKVLNNFAEKVAKEQDVKELKNGRYMNRSIKTLEEIPKQEVKTTTKENMKLTNPGFPMDGRTMNCVLCTTAMAMREKGYNVKAQTSADGHFTDVYFKELFNADTQYTTKKQVYTDLKAYGDGAYGNLTINWKYGGGHSVFWKNEGGQVKIYDGQSGHYIQPKQIQNFSVARKMQVQRLDDKQPSKWVLGVIEPAN